MIPDAVVEAKQAGYGRVVLKEKVGPTYRSLVTIPQRDLYRKYKWPGKEPLQDALRRAA